MSKERKSVFWKVAIFSVLALMLGIGISITMHGIGVDLQTQRVLAAENDGTESPDTYFNWIEDNDEIIITSLTGDGKAATFINYPREIDGKPVIEIRGDSANDKMSITSITIPDTVKILGTNAFSYFHFVNTIIVPDSVTRIDDNAFYFCGITSITIPGSVESIGKNSFSWNAELTSVIIEEGVKSIGETAFYACGYLESIVIPSSVESIEIYAFRDTGLTSVTILGNGATVIGAGAFLNLFKLTNVTIGGGVITIGESAFQGCGNMTSLTIEEGVKNIGNNAFRMCLSVTELTIPNTVENIGESAFSWCTGLTSITIPNGTIGTTAFSGCTNLTNLVIGDGVTSIGDAAFMNCNLSNVTIGIGVTSIGDSAFLNNPSLTNIVIPRSVEVLGNAFGGCPDLVIFAVFESRPAGWSEIIADNSEIVFGCKFINLINEDLITTLAFKPDATTDEIELGLLTELPNPSSEYWIEIKTNGVAVALVSNFASLTWGANEDYKILKADTVFALGNSAIEGVIDFQHDKLAVILHDEYELDSSTPTFTFNLTGMPEKVAKDNSIVLINGGLGKSLSLAGINENNVQDFFKLSQTMIDDGFVIGISNGNIVVWIEENSSNLLLWIGIGLALLFGIGIAITIAVRRKTKNAN